MLGSCKWLVPGGGVEPPWPRGPADFESAASASSAIPACKSASKYLSLKWWPGTGLNRRRRPFQGRALPLSYLASVQISRCNFLRGFRHRRSWWAIPVTVGCNNLCQYTNLQVPAPENRRGAGEVAGACMQLPQPSPARASQVCSTLVGIMRRFAYSLVCFVLPALISPPPGAKPSSAATKKPPRNGSWSGDSVRLRPDSEENSGLWTTSAYARSVWRCRTPGRR